MLLEFPASPTIDYSSAPLTAHNSFLLDGSAHDPTRLSPGIPVHGVSVTDTLGNSTNEELQAKVIKLEASVERLERLESFLKALWPYLQPLVPDSLTLDAILQGNHASNDYQQNNPVPTEPSEQGRQGFMARPSAQPPVALPTYGEPGALVQINSNPASNGEAPRTAEIDLGPAATAHAAMGQPVLRHAAFPSRNYLEEMTRGQGSDADQEQHVDDSGCWTVDVDMAETLFGTEEEGRGSVVGVCNARGGPKAISEQSWVDAASEVDAEALLNELNS